MLHQQGLTLTCLSKSQKESFQSESPTRGEVAKQNRDSLVCRLGSWRIFETGCQLIKPSLKNPICFLSWHVMPHQHRGELQQMECDFFEAVFSTTAPMAAFVQCFQFEDV